VDDRLKAIMDFLGVDEGMARLVMAVEDGEVPGDAYAVDEAGNPLPDSEDFDRWAESAGRWNGEGNEGGD
jgi:hypothetical protein